MTSKEVALIRILEEIQVGQPYSNNTELIQRKMYLAQCVGVDLGYSFIWMLLSPWSTDLTDDLNESLGRTVTKSYPDLKPEIKAKVRLVRDLINSRPHNLSALEWYNLLAFIAYFRERGCSKGAIVKEVMKTKYQYLCADIEHGVDVFYEFKEAGKAIDG